MPISPLQLPGPLVVPQLDFTSLDKIGDVAGKYFENQRLAEAFRGANEQSAMDAAERKAAAAGAAAPTAAPRSSTLTYQRTPYSNAVGLMLDAAPPEIAKDISISSGSRTPERQAQLYDAAVKKYGSEEEARKWVAPPGQSQHEKGNAADLQFASDTARQWAHDNAGKYGLTFPLANEPWHIETAGARTNVASGGQPGQMTLGLRNNNPGYVPDGKVAQALPGYKGAEGGFAAFETPDHGLGAMDALLTSFGRRGIKTGGELVRQLPGMNPNNADDYARFISPNGDPNAPIDFSDPAQRKPIIGRMSIFANNMHGGMGMAAPAALPSQAQMAQAREGMTSGMAKRVEALVATGNPAALKLAADITGRYIGNQEPLIIPRGGMAINRDTGAAIAQNPEARFELKDVETPSGVKVPYVFDRNTGAKRPLTPEEMQSIQQPGEEPLPPGTNPKGYREAQTKAVVKNQEEAVESAKGAAEALPEINAAHDAYERAIKLGAIGPYAGSMAGRAVSKYGMGLTTGGLSPEAEKARQDYDRALAALNARQNILKGQGAVSNYERTLVAAQWPSVEALDPADQIKYLKQAQANAHTTIEAGKKSMLGRQPSVVTERPPIVSSKTAPSAATGPTPGQIKAAQANPQANIDAARAAIAAGKDRAAVIQRLQQFQISIPPDL